MVRRIPSDPYSIAYARAVSDGHSQLGAHVHAKRYANDDAYRYAFSLADFDGDPEPYRYAIRNAYSDGVAVSYVYRDTASDFYPDTYGDSMAQPDIDRRHPDTVSNDGPFVNPDSDTYTRARADAIALGYHKSYADQYATAVVNGYTDTAFHYYAIPNPFADTDPIPDEHSHSDVYAAAHLDAYTRVFSDAYCAALTHLHDRNADNQRHAHAIGYANLAAAACLDGYTNYTTRSA